MRKFGSFITPLVLSTIYLTQVAPVFAQISQCPAGFAGLCSDAIITSGPGLIATFIIAITIVACLFFLIWGGIRWITSGGDKQKIAAARSTLIAAIVGLVISLLAFFIINVVVGAFTGGQGVTGIQIPKLVP